MSKELTPVEAFEKILDMAHEPNGYQNFTNACDTPYTKIVKTALEDYETYKMYTSDEFKEFVYKNDFKSVKNIELAFNSLIKRNNQLQKENEKLKKQITEKNKAKEKMLEIKSIEADLGVNLTTLFKALKKGCWIKYKKPWETKYNHNDMIVFCKVRYYGDEYNWGRSFEIEGDLDETHYFGTSNYGETWALTREELEEKSHE